MTAPRPRTEIDVERLLFWVYREQRADVVLGRGLGLRAAEALQDGVELQGVSGDGLSRLEWIAQLGTQVDGGGPGNADLHPDAEEVHDTVLGLRARILVAFAVTGGRPDWVPEPRPRFFPIRWPNGRPRIEYDEWDRQWRYGWCKVIALDTASSVARARQVYTDWHGCLSDVAASLQARDPLERWIVTGPAAPARPWEA